MKRFAFWWTTKMGSTIACVVGVHNSCTGKASGRVPLDGDSMCLCRCHYKL